MIGYQDMLKYPVYAFSKHILHADVTSLTFKQAGIRSTKGYQSHRVYQFTFKSDDTQHTLYLTKVSAKTLQGVDIASRKTYIIRATV